MNDMPGKYPYCSLCGLPLDRALNKRFDGSRASFCNEKCENAAIRKSRPRSPIKYGPLAGERYVPHFDGLTYEPEKDHGRMAEQMAKVFEIMADGEWHTLDEIAKKVFIKEQSASARIRDLRKERFGGYLVDREPTDIRGIFRYRLRIPKPSTQLTFLQ